MVPSRIDSVTIAAAVRDTHASTPQTGSQTKMASQPDDSASTAASAMFPASPNGITNPKRMELTLAPASDTRPRWR